jgi:hypothetical protein
MTLSYPLDLEMPYQIISYDPINEVYTVLGTAKIMHSTRWIQRKVDFGTHPSIFKMRKNSFLTKANKQQLRWIRKHLGQKLHDVELKKIYDSAIADHIFNDT